MVKLLAILISFSIALAHFWGDIHRSKDRAEAKLLQRIFSDLTGKETVKVFVIGSEAERYKEIFKHLTRKIKVTEGCPSADLIFLAGYIEGEPPKDCRGIPIFSNRRSCLFKWKGCVGSLYWKKGRPNLVFIKERLDLYRIDLPPEYEKFIESERTMLFRRGRAIE